MNISELIKRASLRLADTSDSPSLDAELLLGMVLRKSRTQLYAYGDSSVAIEDEALFSELIEKRLKHVPIAHITGIRDFWTLTLKVSPDTLVPRPETEILVEEALTR
ncbi:MAG: protein-(glutamine-N5) methyltransferase, release factor-specific, partial [Gammaproteobacteria bacterium]|nr:protein-(glutamine-N5) methyltransferase, release factor-specific [Gammaproteobacteria bacterium]